MMNTPPPHSPPSLTMLFLAFSRLGVTSFGGGLSGWIMRELVHRRKWISEQEFVNGLALSQAFPGINVVNLAMDRLPPAGRPRRAGCSPGHGGAGHGRRHSYGHGVFPS